MYVYVCACMCVYLLCVCVRVCMSECACVYVCAYKCIWGGKLDVFVRMCVYNECVPEKQNTRRILFCVYVRLCMCVHVCVSVVRI